jgi:hypothetical protein
MTLREIFEAGTNLCGFASADHSPASVRAEIFRSITAALQLMQAAGEEYYGRETLSFELDDAQTGVILPQNVQTVLPPVRLTGRRALRQLSTQAEYDQFTSLYLAGEPTADPLSYFVHTGKASNLLTPTGNMIVAGAGTTGIDGVYVRDGMQNGKPRYVFGSVELEWDTAKWVIKLIINPPSAFFYSSSENTADPSFVTSWSVGPQGTSPVPTVTAEMLLPFPDNVKTTIFLAPAAGTTTPDLLIDAILEPPTYTVANLCDDTVPPVPHKYHESILVPLVRYNVTMTKYFRQQEGSNLLGQLKEDYARALQLLGLNNPDRKAGSTMPPPPKPEEEQEGAN